MAKDTNFKFGTHASRKSPDVTPEKFWKKGVVRVTWRRTWRWHAHCNERLLALCI